MEVGKKYTLDGNIYRCEVIRASGLGWFQALNVDGSHKESLNKCGQVTHSGRCIIFNRINELKEYEANDTIHN